MSDPDWWKKAVFYQVYPRSYKDTNGDGIGDLPGITDRLEYIASLGIDAIWISPFFQSPMADYGYDVSDYRMVDPLFGSNEDFDILLQKAHGLGIKIIIDMVLSHTSIEHPWFIESRLSKTNRKADWYVWADPKDDGSPPNNWQSCFSGSAWTFDTKREQYYLHNFLKDQPDLNFHNEEVQEQVLSECEFWLERGVDGFRLDTCNFYVHDKELRDNPPKKEDETISGGLQYEKLYPYTMQRHIYDKTRPENLEFLARLRQLMDRFPDKFTIGEVGDDDPYAVGITYTSGEKYLNTTYNTHFIAGTDSQSLTTDMIVTPISIMNEKGSECWPSWAFGNHDVVRPVTRWGKDIRNKDAFAAMLNKLLLSLRGTVFLYQGEELGLPEAIIPYDRIQDPWGKTMWPEWQGRDGCRTPMPWNNEKPRIGFTKSSHAWLPIPNDHIKRAVNTQENDKNSVLNQTRDFIAWRKTKPALQTGDISFIKTNEDTLLVFDRTLDDIKIRCIFNLNEETKTFDGKEILPLEAKFIEESL
jgi:alpha-glucosidase